MNRNNRRILPWLLAVLALMATCGSPERDHQVVEGLAGGSLELGNERQLALDVQIADTAPAQQKGLMEVDSIPDDYGLVFLWAEPGRHSFHMKNTLIPLDIAWWNADMEIVDIQTMQPCENEPCPTYTPAGDHVAAVEVNAGLLESNGIEVGEPVRLTNSWPSGL